MRRLALLVLVSWLSAPAVVRAVIETYQFSSPNLELRYHALSQELRCPKCQNQNIADSNAPIARDLRVVLYEQLEAGASDEEILAYMVARYGEFVRYRPSVDRNTLFLWAAPALLLVAGAGLVVWQARRGGKQAQPLSATEQEEISRLLEEQGG